MATIQELIEITNQLTSSKGRKILVEGQLVNIETGRTVIDLPQIVVKITDNILRVPASFVRDMPEGEDSSPRPLEAVVRSIIGSTPPPTLSEKWYVKAFVDADTGSIKGFGIKNDDNYPNLVQANGIIRNDDLYVEIELADQRIHRNRLAGHSIVTHKNITWQVWDGYLAKESEL